MEVARRFTRRLHELPSEELELIAGLFVRREVHKGELLISEKDIARDIVFVERKDCFASSISKKAGTLQRTLPATVTALCVSSAFSPDAVIAFSWNPWRKASSGAFRMQDWSNSLSVICI